MTVARMASLPGGSARQAARMSCVSLISEDLVEGYREVTNAFAGRVVDRVANRRRSSGDADLTRAFGANRADELVLFGHQDDVDRTNVGTYRHVVFGKV